MEDSQKGGQYLCNCDTQGLQGATALSRGGQHQGSLCWRKVCFLENMALKQVFMESFDVNRSTAWGLFVS